MRPGSRSALCVATWLRYTRRNIPAYRSRVELNFSRLARPTLDEAVALGAKRDRLLWVREVALRVDEQTLVFAHSVLPPRPRGPLCVWLARLGKRSLGAQLFAHPGFTRGAITCKQLDARHALFQLAIEAMQLTDAPPATLWARRSRFSFGAQSVLVTEVFSPALVDD